MGMFGDIFQAPISLLGGGSSPLPLPMPPALKSAGGVNKFYGNVFTKPRGAVKYLAEPLSSLNPAAVLKKTNAKLNPVKLIQAGPHKTGNVMVDSWAKKVKAVALHPVSSSTGGLIGGKAGLFDLKTGGSGVKSNSLRGGLSNQNNRYGVIAIATVVGGEALFGGSAGGAAGGGAAAAAGGGGGWGSAISAVGGVAKAREAKKGAGGGGGGAADAGGFPVDGAPQDGAAALKSKLPLFVAVGGLGLLVLAKALV